MIQPLRNHTYSAASKKKWFMKEWVWVVEGFSLCFLVHDGGSGHTDRYERRYPLMCTLRQPTTVTLSMSFIRFCVYVVTDKVQKDPVVKIPQAAPRMDQSASNWGRRRSPEQRRWQKEGFQYFHTSNTLRKAMLSSGGMRFGCGISVSVGISFFKKTLWLYFGFLFLCSCCLGDSFCFSTFILF